MGTQQPLWDPVKYVEFGDFRNRPYSDLTSRITADAPRDVVDLGCGPGNLTATLARRWPGAKVLGLDSSPEMIATAGRSVSACRSPSSGNAEAYDAASPLPAEPRFELADIRAWMPGPSTDVVVSNAALQWVPDHRDLMAGWLAALAPGSWLAVQVPGNFSAPSHTLMRSLADSPHWRKRLDGVLRHQDAVGEPGEYHDLLLRAGATADVWETTYSQLLSGPHPVLEWVRGTGLRPVLQVLSKAEGKEFVSDYSALLDEAYPVGGFGTIYPFRRIFMVAQKQ